MSKSLGNFVDLEAISRYTDHYGLDGFRYFLMVEGPIASQDSNFSSARVHEVYNTDLVNTLGRAMQVDPVNPTLKAPGTKCLKLKCDKLLSNVAFNFTCAAKAGQLAEPHQCHDQQVLQRGRGAHRGEAVQVASLKTRVESA